MGKRSKKNKRTSRPQRRGYKNWLYFLVAVVVTAAIGLGVVVVADGNSDSGSATPTTPESGSSPDWLVSASRPVKEAYAYAVAHPETLGYIPCYCGCGAHSGHRSIHDCFVADRYSDGSVAYDLHGKDCDMCIDSALMTRDMLSQGKSLKEARQAVVQKYSYLGPATDTPPLP